MENEPHNYVLSNGLISKNSHAYSYGFISFQTAWLKANYPLEYMSALLSSIDDRPKAAIYISDCKLHDINVLVPDVNKSERAFKPEGSDIRFSLLGIKNVGEGPVESIIAERANGPYISFQDFCKRVDVAVLNKRTLESLIKAGAFDSLGHSRIGLLDTFDTILKANARRKKDHDAGALTLFADSDEVPIPNSKLSKKDRLSFEREMLGLYITDHPLLGAEKALSKRTNQSIETLEDLEDGEWVDIGGVITNINKKKTKKGDYMATFTLSDVQYAVECVVFTKLFEEVSDMLIEDNILILRGRVSTRNDTLNVIVNGVEIFDPIIDGPPPLYLQLKNLEQNQIEKIKHCISMHPGKSLVYIKHNNKTFLLPEEYNVSNDTGLKHELSVALGLNL